MGNGISTPGNIIIVGGRTFKCSTNHAKRSFHRAIDAIFGKIRRLASEEVIFELVKNKCMPCLLYEIECYTLPKSSLRSIDFVVVRFLMKLFKTVNNEIIFVNVVPISNLHCQANY